MCEVRNLLFFFFFILIAGTAPLSQNSSNVCDLTESTSNLSIEDAVQGIICIFIDSEIFSAMAQVD